MTRPSHAALVDLVRPEWRAYAAMAVVVTAAGALPVVGPLFTRIVVDRAAAGATSGELLPAAIGFLAAAVAAQVAQVAASWWANRTAWRTADRLRSELTARTLDLGLAFHGRHGAGTLVQRIDGDLIAVSDLLGRVVHVVGGGLVTLFGIAVALLVLHPPLGLGFVVYLALFAALVVGVRRRSVAEAAAELGATGALLGEIEEVLTAAEDLRTLDAHDHVVRRFLERSRDWAASVRETFDAYLSIHRLVSGGVAAGLVIAVAAGGLLSGSDGFTLGTSFALLQYALQTRRPLDDMVSQTEVIQRAVGAMSRVASLRAEPPAVPDEGTSTLPPGPPSVIFDGVSFAYEGGPTVVRGVDLELPAGRRLGLVGRTGSGKTTLARLALRLADPDEGAVRLAGVALPDLRIDSWRGRVAFLDQHVRLVTGSVRDNVTLFDRTVTDEDVRSALREVGLDPVVQGLSHGLDTVVGPGGTGLSAGEAQLVALARLWLRDPDLVVLDEATAAVDPSTERRLSGAVDRLLEGRTAIVVAHRLATLDRVDLVAVVDDGRLVEIGAPDELLAGGGHYARLRALSAGEHAGGDGTIAVDAAGAA